MEGFKFDTEKLEKLNDPERLKDIPPEFIREKLAVEYPGTVVDVGAGTGFFSIRFALMQEVDRVYALDIADVMVEYMKKNVSPFYKTIEPMKMDESSLPLPDNLAGVIVMINLHHELHEPVKLLEECSRVLKPGGKLAIIDWKKKETEHGPPLEKRYGTELIREQLLEIPFQSIGIYDELPHHFLMVGENG
ncbi:MAG: class I SAM-dependent methyltransferase [Bacteroidales bacterium]|nr:class I SAM-dependent methyltransferase [Bacteroidales bacterium]